MRRARRSPGQTAAGSAACATAALQPVRSERHMHRMNSGYMNRCCSRRAPEGANTCSIVHRGQARLHVVRVHEIGDGHVHPEGREHPHVGQEAHARGSGGCVAAARLPASASSPGRAGSRGRGTHGVCVDSVFAGPQCPIDYAGTACAVRSSRSARRDEAVDGRDEYAGYANAALGDAPAQTAARSLRRRSGTNT